MSEIVGIGIVVAGLAVVLLGLLWLIVRAFRTKIWWGLAVLFLPGAVLVYLVKHWDRARRPFVVVLVGGLLVAVPYGINFAEERLHSLGPHEQKVDGELHLTLTGWDRTDYSPLQWKQSAVVLQMANPDVTDETLQFITGMNGLKEIDLNDTQVTDAGLKVLAALPKLEIVRLRGTKVTDEGFRESLFEKESLRELDLRKTQVSRATVGEWKKENPERKALR